MSISFEKRNDKLILVYVPAMGIDDMMRQILQNLWQMVFGKKKE